MEVAPSSWRMASFDVPPLRLRPGLVEAGDVLQDWFPAGVRAYWERAASFQLVIHSSRRSLHWRSWETSRKAIRFARALRPDVFHIDDVDVSPRLPLALSTSARLPIVLTVHDPEPHSGEENWRKSLGRRLSYRKASRFLLHSRELQDPFCLRYGIAPERVDVVRMGAMDIFQEWEAEPATALSPTVLFFGRLSPYKGLKTLYDAAPRVADAVPGVRFVVAGRRLPHFVPPEPPDLPPPAKVDVLDGYIPNGLLGRLFRESSVVACPYTDATQSAVLLTAYGFGKPVVASAVGGLPEYVEEGRTGLLVPPGDSDQLAVALIRVLSDADLRSRLEAGILAERSAGLSWARAAAETMSCYESID